MCLEDKERTFAFEKSFCLLRSEVWLHEAQNLFYSADVLGDFEGLKQSHLFRQNDHFAELFPFDLTNHAFFNWRVQRMLWAYGFENLFKFMIVAQYREAHPDAVEVPFSEIKSHNLAGLAKKVGFDLEEPQEFYLGVLQKCALWAGRYPLPIKKKDMYDQREALPTQEALLERSREAIERHQRDEIPRTFTESDVLHSQMGDEELRICRGLREEAFVRARSILKKDEVSQQSVRVHAAPPRHST
ncbi:hypothetical protein [Wenzhouxiangella sp. XN24]|uniref:hypothetical protein n=1 Tax=Wenzhouxiangella sp. XN24 TaxID=2713569 RepID=UPI0013ED2FE3|nr:hypothetical protein [Wenzhouxiangella sp. XN24]NGX15592.1 hypothetical protein [Wenzhouxiangella sp. XN24]